MDWVIKRTLYRWKVYLTQLSFEWCWFNAVQRAYPFRTMVLVFNLSKEFHINFMKTAALYEYQFPVPGKCVHFHPIFCSIKFVTIILDHFSVYFFSLRRRKCWWEKNSIIYKYIFFLFFARKNSSWKCINYFAKSLWKLFSAVFCKGHVKVI